MEKTEMMKKYEAETGKQSAIVKFMAGGQALETKTFPKLGPFDYSVDYIAWLEAELQIATTRANALQNAFDRYEAKAAAYDMLSIDSISENEISIVLDGNAWCAYRLPFRNLQEDDAGFGSTPQMALAALLTAELPEEREVK